MIRQSERMDVNEDGNMSMLYVDLLSVTVVHKGEHMHTFWLISGFKQFILYVTCHVDSRLKNLEHVEKLRIDRNPK
jgi:hypothetical protein